MNNWLTLAAAIVSAALTGGAVVALINAVAGRKARKAEVADRLSDSSLKWVQEFQEETARSRQEATEARQEAAEARREAADSRREAADARREATEARRQVAELATEVRDLRTLRMAILSPTATLEQLRTLAVNGPNMNSSH